MMTHVVIFYILTVLSPDGHVTMRQYPTYEMCNSMKMQLDTMAQQTHQHLATKCVPQQESRPVAEPSSTPPTRERQ